MSEQLEDGQNLAEVFARLDHRERQIAAIHRISEALVSRLSVDELIRETLNLAIDIVRADTGSVLLHDPESGMLVFRYVTAPADELLTGYPLPTSKGIAGRVFRTGKADLDENVAQTPDFNRSVDDMTGYVTHSMLTVPLKRPQGPPIGVMQVLNLREPFSGNDLEVLEVLGNQAATAIENARLAELARRAEVSTVIGNVAHDIYNMLTPLASGIPTLEPMLKRLFERLDSIQEECMNTPGGQSPAAALAAAMTDVRPDCGWILQHAQSSIDRVMARTRWIAGAVKGKLPEPVMAAADLNVTVREVMAALEGVARERGLAMRLDLDDDLPQTRFDPEHIYNALYNLVNNAIPATPAGGSITLRTRGPGPGEDAVLVEVADTGRGMSAEMLSKLFTDAATSTTGGTGLGTRIVKHVITQHGGSISVASEEGRGSTFSIRLPLNSDFEDAPSQDPPSGEA